MSSTALYDYSIPVFVHMLQNVLAFMTKAEEYAKEKGDNIDDYTELRIHPDMKTFGHQIRFMSDNAKFVLVRVAGYDQAELSIEDDEKTWADFRGRLEKTIAILEKSSAKDFEGKEGVEVSLFGGKYKFSAPDYIRNFATPNFYFHCTTAYDLLRMKNVPVGKLDFLTGHQMATTGNAQ